jgi:hypothetical protein
MNASAENEADRNRASRRKTFMMMLLGMTMTSKAKKSACAVRRKVAHEGQMQRWMVPLQREGGLRRHKEAANFSSLFASGSRVSSSSRSKVRNGRRRSFDLFLLLFFLYFGVHFLLFFGFFFFLCLI